MSLNFFKNLNNIQINPATEDTLAQIQSNTAGIDMTTAALATNTATLNTETAAVVANTANILPTKRANTANSMPVTIASDQTLPVFGQMKFDTSTTMTADAADSLFYLRKVVKQLEPKSTMDASKRQRIYVDGSSSGMTISTTTVLSTLAGYDQKMNQYSARNAFARGIRSRLIFS